MVTNHLLTGMILQVTPILWRASNEKIIPKQHPNAATSWGSVNLDPQKNITVY